MPDTRPLPILLIGGGLSSLSLALSLQSQQPPIPFLIFERDNTALSRAQGYRIRIVDTHLRQLLPAELWQRFENTCAEVVQGGRRLNALTGELAPAGPGGAGGRPPGLAHGSTKTYNADRRIMRNLMIEELLKCDAGCVHFGKKFMHYEVVDSGMMAHFEDGSTVMGTLLIGADGSRSVVRRQLLPDFPLLDSEARAIFGRTVLNEGVRQLVTKNLWQGGIALVVDGREEKGLKLFCDTMCFQRRAETNVSLPEDYVMWVLCARKDGTDMEDEKFMRLGQDDCYAKSLDLVGGWNEAVQELVKRQIPGAAATLGFATTSLPIEAWKTNPRVTLIGDAAHPMLPVGGVGANAAFHDATLLLKAILGGATSENIASYEESMRQEASRYLEGSLHGGRHMFGMKPIEQLRPWTVWT